MLVFASLDRITRINAFLIHLGISLFIFFIILYFIIFHWYPQPFFTTDGGWQGIRIIIGVDVVLGPVLTLIVFKPGKPGLKFDLSLIALAQTTALTWGIWAVYHERPVAVVFTEDHFTTVPAYQISETGVASDFLSSFGDATPALIYSNLPEKPDKLSAVRVKSLQQGTPMYLFTEFYTPLKLETIKKIKSRSIDLKKFMVATPESEALIQAVIDKYDNKTGEYAFTAVFSRYKQFIGVFNTRTKQIVEIVDVNPRKYLLKLK